MGQDAERSRKAMALPSADVGEAWLIDKALGRFAKEQSMLDAKLQETGEKERLKECPACCCQARIYDEQNVVSVCRTSYFLLVLTHVLQCYLLASDIVLVAMGEALSAFFLD